MNATFYVSTAPTHKVDKTEFLTVIKTLNGLKPYEPFDGMEGQLILAYDEDLMSANYAKVDDWYYFVKEPITRIGKQIVMALSKDPLMSNLEDILNLNVIMDRNAIQFNSYIFDDRQLGQVNYTTFSAALGSWDYFSGWTVLVVIGGDSDAV
jgi:hypothetical protein